MRSYEIDYDDLSDCTESFNYQKKGRTAKGNELSPAKMPLMRIRSVEIVFEDDMSTCTDTGILDRSIELVSDSDDSTKCVDEMEVLNVERDDVTLNAEADLSDDNSTSFKEAVELIEPQSSFQEVECHVRVTSLIDDVTSLNLSDVVDSGRYTEDASPSHFDLPILCEDALLSHSLDVIDKSTAFDISEVCSISSEGQPKLLYEYIDSSDSSEDTAVCEDPPLKYLCQNLPITVEDTDVNDLQYDSFIDMGKF